MLPLPAPPLARRLAGRLRRAPRVRFCLAFAAWLLVFAWLFEIGHQAAARLYLRPLCEVATAGLHLLQIPARMDATPLSDGYCLIALERTTLRVIHECTGLFTLLAFLAATLAFPAALRSRVAGAAAGAAAFFLYGSGRLVLLGAVGQVAPEWVSAIHLWLMAVANLGFACFLWLAWARRASTHA